MYNYSVYYVQILSKPEIQGVIIEIAYKYKMIIDHNKNYILIALTNINFYPYLKYHTYTSLVLNDFRENYFETFQTFEFWILYKLCSTLYLHH